MSESTETETNQACNIEIYCVNNGESIAMDGGASLLDLQNKTGDILSYKPLCARVNNKIEGLGYKIYGPKTVEFLPPSHPASQYVYVRSLCMILYKAVTECLPSAQLKINHSVSRGYYCTIDGMEGISPSVISKIRSRMETIVSMDIPFVRHEERTTVASELFRAERLDDKVLFLDTIHDLYTVFYTLDGLADSYYSALAPSTGFISCFDLVPYHKGMLLMPPLYDDNGGMYIAPPVPQEKMFSAFTEHMAFNSIVGIGTVGELNRAVEDGRSAMIVNVAEALHNKSIAVIADDIAARHHSGGARVVLIAGPSSSGKTTFTKRLAIQLMTNLLKPEMISLDNYFVNREQTPLDPSGDYDYESIYALDLEKFNADLSALLRGEEIHLPYYNFERGCREYRDSDKMKLSENTILLIEGIHGLNPELTPLVPAEMKYRVYVSALTTISIDNHNWVPTTENRLLRRIIRDYKYRGVGPAETIRRWPSVRRGEEKWIFPYQENADITFNSSLLFELGVMKQEGEAVLNEVPRDLPEYSQAYSLKKLLGCFYPISATHVPSTSLLREFLGGSSFHY